MRLYIIICLLIANCIFTGCASKQGFSGKAIYAINGGSTKVNPFNREKAKIEALILSNIKLNEQCIKTASELSNLIKSMEPGVVIVGIKTTIDKVIEELNRLNNELNNSITYDNKGLEKANQIGKKILDLMAQKIGPASKVVIENSKIKELKSDVAFETGSFKLKETGVAEISFQVKEIENKIIYWKQYLNNNDIKIFENDLYKLKIVIKGYADLQGSLNVTERKKDNLELSEKRAESVKNEFKKQLDMLIEKHKLITDIQYYGKGEELPPNVIDNGLKNNPARRVCLIMSVVSPSSLLIEK